MASQSNEMETDQVWLELSLLDLKVLLSQPHFPNCKKRRWTAYPTPAPFSRSALSVLPKLQAPFTVQVGLSRTMIHTGGGS